MNLALALLALLLGLVYTASEATSREWVLPIEGKLVTPDKNGTPRTELALNGGEFRTISRADGSFTFHDIPSGIYLLDVYSPLYHFSQLKLKVSAENASISVVEYKYHGAPRVPAQYPIVLTAYARMQYEIPKPPFSLIGMIMGNPMIIMMLFTGLLAFAMPKMMANMSPEELEELKRQSAQSGDPMAKLSQLMTGGAPKDEEDD